ncbi:hypothetical protein SAMN05421505_101182 [Sinosporangium album]|uniref:Cupin n=1 Tax=Sinosporangium album TaxID=504805 RepID=A0A1G7QZD8_9ACTN|nr:hypothetical protein [Sinosporangium album]SDG03845.1 hypothetical protein SAMN05421505_101182 [Sinosporangium album]
MTYPKDYPGVVDALRAGGAEPFALAVLDSLVFGLSPLVAVRHPLGFLCLPVVRDGEYGVCLHIWSAAFPMAEPTTSRIHCHSWDLTSHVLYGHVGNELAEVRDADLDPTHRVLEVVSGADGDRIRPTARTVRLRRGASELWGPGDTYALPAGVFHSSVIPEGGEAATVALGRTIPGSGDLSLGPLDAAPHHVRRTLCDAAETARAAHLAHGLLARARPPT